MSTKRFRHILISLATISILCNLLTNPLTSATPLYEDTGLNDTSENNAFPAIVFSIAQNDTRPTDLTNTTTVPETTDTNTTTDEFPDWTNPFVDDNLYYPFALIFSILGIFSAIWLVFFVETSKERTIRERILGSTIRLIVMSIFLGLAIHYWYLFQPI